MFTNTLLRERATSASTLTSSYTDNSVIVKVSNHSQLLNDVEYTPGENNAVLEIKYEFSQDKSNWYERVSKNSGTSNITIYQTPTKFTGTTASTAYKFEEPVNCANIWVRVSFKETASVAGTINFELNGAGEV